MNKLWSVLSKRVSNENVALVVMAIVSALSITVLVLSVLLLAALGSVIVF